MSKPFSAVLRRLIRYFLAGLMAILPLVLTIGIVMWLAGFLEDFVGPKTVLGRGLESLGLKFATNKTAAYAIGWLCVLGVIFALGVVVDSGAKRVLEGALNAIIRRIPIIGNIYGTSQQLIEMFERKGDTELKGMSVVFCYFGSRGGSGVLALMPSPERFTIEGVDYHIVVIPTAPVPFGGGLLFVPVDLVQPTEMSVDGLMNVYISMGVTTPQVRLKSAGMKSSNDA